MKKRRRLAWAVGVGLLLVVAVLLGGWYYLNSAAGARLVARELEKILGGRVSIARLRAGTDRLVIEGLFVRDAADEIWLTVDRVRVDASLLDLARGRLPTRVELERVHLDLHFGQDGQLRTQLLVGEATPDGELALPVVVLRESKLTLRQDGREPFVIHGIEATADPTHANGAPLLTGTVTDPVWGHWTGQADVDLARQIGTLSLTTDQLHANMPMLRRVPFVPSEVWEQIELEGKASMNLSLGIEPGGAFTYRVAADLHDAAAYVVPIGLRTTHGRGSVVVEAEVVTLGGLHGQTAGGRLDASGKLDFSQADAAKLQFDLVAQALDLRQLPTAWKLPPELEGSLTGRASVELHISGEHLKVRGSGEGAVQNARVLGVAAEGVRLRLTERPGGLRFEQPKQTGKEPRPGNDQRPGHDPHPGDDAPPTPPPPQCSATPTPKVRPVPAMMLVPTVTLASAPTPRPLSRPTPLRRQPNSATPDVGDAYLEIDVTFPEIDVADLVKRLDLKLDVPLAGTGAASLTLALPIAQADDPRTYRVDGQVQLHTLAAGPVRLERIRSQLRLRDGKLTLSELAARWADCPDIAGTIIAHAEAQLVPLGRLHAHARCHDLALECLSDILDQPNLQAVGFVSGGGSVEVSLDRITDPKAWTATARISAASVRVDTLFFESPSIQAKLASGVVSVTEATTRAAGADVMVQGFLHLDQQLTFDASWSARGLDLERLARKLPDLRDAIGPKGTLDLKGTLTGALVPMTVGGTAEIATTRPLTLRGLPIRSLRAELDATPERLRVAVRGRTLDGSVQVEGSVPLRQEQPVRATVRLVNLQLRAIARDLRLGRELEALDGQINGNFQLQRQPDGNFVGDGELRLAQLTWEGKLLARGLQAFPNFDGTQVRFNRLNGSVGDGQLAGTIVVRPEAVLRGYTNVRLSGCNLQQLAVVVPGLAKQVRGRVDVQLRAQLGNRFNGTLELTSSQLRLGAFELFDLNIPANWEYDPVGMKRLSFTEARAQAGLGRVTARASIDYDSAIRLSGDLRFIEVELRNLLRGLGEGQQFGAGRASGRIEFEAAQLRSLNDLTATVQARLPQFQALQFPVLRAIAPYLPLGQTPNTAYREGEFKANLAKGVLRVQKLALQGTNANLFIDGTVTTQGRLGLNVVATTGQIGPPEGVLGLLRLRLPNVGPVPIGLIQDVTQLLSNRSVHLRIAGTVQTPTITVEPLPLLTEEAVRFFLRQLVPVPVPVPVPARTP